MPVAQLPPPPPCLLAAPGGGPGHGGGGGGGGGLIDAAAWKTSGIPSSDGVLVAGDVRVVSTLVAEMV